MDSNTRRQKHQALMAELVERRVRNRARQLYDKRGQVQGHALQDWLQAESEVLENSVLAPLYRRLRANDQQLRKFESDGATQRDSSTRENHL